MELAVGDVERDARARPRPQQAVREPARRGADVEAQASARRDVEAGERALELEAAARDVSRAVRRPRPATSSETSMPGLAARSRSGPSRTAPARTDAAALLRDSKRPRSTSSVSRRFFALMR